ncbi:MAG: hypothetical protein FWD32_02305 [Firmicutes bacterium]|nr:hypothetical protein [Bacillota bacterium]
MNKINVSEVLDCASELLQLPDDPNNISLLKRCLNIVISDIATNYYDCRDVKTFNVTNNQIEYSQFERRIFRVVKIYVNGVICDYSLFAGFIRVPNGVVAVEYTYIPEIDQALNTVYLPAINQEGVIYGVMAEYAIVSGMFNEAKVWNERFNSFLFSAKLNNKNIVLPTRQWR